MSQPTRSTRTKRNEIPTHTPTRESKRQRTEAAASETSDLDDTQWPTAATLKFDRPLPRTKFPDRLREGIEDLAFSYIKAVRDGRRIQKHNRYQRHNDSEPNWTHPGLRALTNNREGWEPEDEAVVAVEYASHERPRSFKEEYKALWKICLRYMRCTPWDIVGVKRKLAFSAIARGTGRGRLDRGIFTWSQSFSTSLKALVTHPAWISDWPGERKSKLAAAIQYAVILRTGDTARWEIGLRGQFWEIVQQAVDKVGSEGMDTIPAAHAAARKTAKRQGLEPPQLSDIFTHLEDVVTVQTEGPAPDSPYRHYVKTSDLHILTEALDTFTDTETGVRLYVPTSLLFRTAEANRNKVSNDHPKSNEELEEYHELAIMDQLREVRTSTRLGGLPASTDSMPAPDTPQSRAREALVIEIPSSDTEARSRPVRGPRAMDDMDSGDEDGDEGGDEGGDDGEDNGEGNSTDQDPANQTQIIHDTDSGPGSDGGRPSYYMTVEEDQAEAVQAWQEVRMGYDATNVN